MVGSTGGRGAALDLFALHCKEKSLDLLKYKYCPLIQLLHSWTMHYNMSLTLKENMARCKLYPSNKARASRDNF